MQDSSQLKLEKWKSLLLRIDINLEGIVCEKIYYPYKIRELDVYKFRSFYRDLSGESFEEELSILNEQCINEFELALNRKLPEDYKYYCQVFGKGIFGIKNICIDCPDIGAINEYLGSSQGILEACLETYRFEGIADHEIEQLIENALIFGHGSDYLIFVFDLRSYDEEDKSCEIYGLKYDYSNSYIRKIGRNFFTFVRDSIVGEGLKREFPELIFPLPVSEEESLARGECRYKGTTFTPIPKYDSLEY